MRHLIQLTLVLLLTITAVGCGVSQEAVDTTGETLFEVRQALRQVRGTAREVSGTAREVGRTAEETRKSGQKVRMLKKKKPVLELKNGVPDKSVTVKVQPVGSSEQKTAELALTEKAQFTIPTSRFVDSRTKSFDTEVYQGGEYVGSFTLEVKRRFFEDHQEGANILTLKVVNQNFKWTGPAEQAGMAITNLN